MYDETHGRLAAARSAILSWAFSGYLTSSIDYDEPAELLARRMMVERDEMMEELTIEASRKRAEKRSQAMVSDDDTQALDAHDYLASILRSSGPLAPKDLWGRSKLRYRRLL